MRLKTIQAGAYGGPAIHPGEVLREEYLMPMNLSVYALAKALHVPQTRLAAILAGRRSITADTAIRLGIYFRTTPDFWVNLQSQYDLRCAAVSDGERIHREVETCCAVGAAD